MWKTFLPVLDVYNLTLLEEPDKMDVRVILSVCLITAAVLTHVTAASTNGIETVCETYGANFSVPVCTGCLSHTGLDAESICTDCEDIHCRVCNDGLSQNCTQCDAGYGLSSASYICQPCLNPNCSSCLETRSGLLDECVGCLYDLVLHTGTAPAICLGPQADCSNHSSTELVSGTTTPVCDTCNTGYFVTQTGVCQLCMVDSCTRCFNSTHCTQCDSGYALNVGVCTVCQDILCHECASDGDTCISCLTGYGVGNSSTCQGCSVDHCALCNSGAGSCDACIDGYILINTTCTACPDNCTAIGCYVDKGGQALCASNLCTPGFYESSGLCYACARSNCSQCETDPMICDMCSTGYALYADTCYECMEYCELGGCNATWNGSSVVTNCANCNSSSAPRFNDSVIISCEACVNCLNCSFDHRSQMSVCDANECLYGFFWDNTTASCSACPEGSDACAVNVTSGFLQSTSCASGYVMYSNTCLACSFACEECVLIGGFSYCDRCSSGYAVQNGYCFRCDLGCAECSIVNGIILCDTCSSGYRNDTVHGCVSCPLNCERCAENDPGTLACQAGGCSSGYSLRDDTTLCRPCQIEHCAECADADDTGTVRCTKCIRGTSLSEDGTQCLNCVQQYDRCTSCEAGLACIACPDGYILQDGQCIESCFVCDEAEDCGSPGGANLYPLVTCPEKPCYVSVTGDGQTGNATYERGCASFTVCSDDRALGICSLDEHGTMLCSRCCTGPGCNTYSVNLLNLHSNSPVMMKHILPEFMLLLSVVHFIFS